MPLPARSFMWTTSTTATDIALLPYILNVFLEYSLFRKVVYTPVTPPTPLRSPASPRDGQETRWTFRMALLTNASEILNYEQSKWNQSKGNLDGTMCLRFMMNYEQHLLSCHDEDVDDFDSCRWQDLCYTSDEEPEKTKHQCCKRTFWNESDWIPDVFLWLCDVQRINHFWKFQRWKLQMCPINMVGLIYSSILPAVNSCIPSLSNYWNIYL